MRAFLFVLTALAISLCSCGQTFAAVEVPFQLRHGLISVPVAVPATSEPLVFVVDSGAGTSVIDLAVARRLGLRLGTPRRISGVNTSASAWEVKDFVARVGEIAAPSSLLALDLGALPSASGVRIDGLLGLDFLRGHLVEVCFASKSLRFHRRGEIHPAGERIRLIVRNDALCVRAFVDGSATLLRLDTGCDSPVELVRSEKEARAGRISSVAVMTTQPKQTTADVQLGSARVANVSAGLHSRRLFPGEDGLLGLGVLSRFDQIIDVTGKALYLRKRVTRSP